MEMNSRPYSWTYAIFASRATQLMTHNKCMNLAFFFLFFMFSPFFCCHFDSLGRFRKMELTTKFVQLGFRHILPALRRMRVKRGDSVSSLERCGEAPSLYRSIVAVIGWRDSCWTTDVLLLWKQNYNKTKKVSGCFDEQLHCFHPAML